MSYLIELTYSRTHLQVPVVDFQGIKLLDSRKQIIAHVKHTSEKWGFFHVVIHAIPLTGLKRIIEGVHLFHEQDLEAQKQLYTYDLMKES